MKLRVGVIFGGRSVEHEISIISALGAIEQIDKEKYAIVPIYISKENEFFTGDNLLKIDNYKDLDKVKIYAKKVTLCRISNEICLVNIKGHFSKIIDKIDIALPIVHGQNVEDGTLAGFLEMLNVPYVGSSIIGSALGQDKVIMKQVFKVSSIPVVDFVCFFDHDYENNEDYYIEKIEELKYPVIVKPASLGSSVGINFVNNKEELKKAIEKALEYDSKIIVEKAVLDAIEVNCSVIGDCENVETSVIEEVNSSHNFLTYNDKYIGNGKTKSKGMINTSRIIPARIDDEMKEKIENLSKKVFQSLNLAGVCRIDFLINNKTREVFVNEPNTIPGSLSYYLWEAKGKEYKELLDDLITLGIKQYKKKMLKTTCFKTNILDGHRSIKK